MYRIVRLITPARPDAVWCPTQVLWVDLLTRKEFEAGFGSHTPMYSGQTKCVRYYMNFRRALELHKEVLLEAGAANDAGNAPIALGSAAKRAAIQAASDAGEMWATIGADSWIVVPIASVAKPDRRLEGTRLTLVAMQAQPDGYEFSIRTPVTPPRWAEFDAELEAAWDNLLDAMVDGDPPPPPSTLSVPFLLMLSGTQGYALPLLMFDAYLYDVGQIMGVSY